MPAIKGRALTAEHKNKIRLALKGIAFTEEHKLAMKKPHRPHKRPNRRKKDK